MVKQKIIFQVIFGILYLIFASSLLLNAPVSRLLKWNKLNSENSATTTAMIIGRGEDRLNNALVSYRYMVNGISYEQNSQTFYGKTPPNSPLEIRYLIANPQVAEMVANKPLKIKDMAYFVLGIGMPLLVGVIAYDQFTRRKPPTRDDENFLDL